VPADPEEVLVSHLDLIERLIAFTVRRHGLVRVEAEEFASTVKLKLVEDDFAVLRSFERRSSSRRSST
jgi:hypothetical protein